MAFDAFLKVGDVEGESTDDKHKGWIEILSYNQQITQPTSGSMSSGGGISAERANFQNFSIVKALDKASPKLALACSNGQHYPEVTVQLCRATENKAQYMEYKMEDVLVTKYSPGGSSSGGEALPVEEVSFAFGKITWIYTELDHKTGQSKGNLDTHWDLTTNTGG